MDDVTDTVFRQIIADCAKPDLFMTEFTNADGLQSAGRERLLKKLQFTDKEQPIIAQIWGKVPTNYEKTARELVKMGFSGIDINMGCPIRVIVKNGCCSALIDNRQLAESIIKATKKGADGLPVSVKTRLGISEIDYSWHEFLLKQNLDALIVHGRTANKMSNMPADWGAISNVRELRDKISPKTKIIGNGDVLNLKQAKELAEKYKLDGVMIGRGVFQDPFVFDPKSPWSKYSVEQKKQLYKKHIELFAKTWTKGERKLHTLNKFCKIYINGFDGAKELREKLMSAQSIKELIGLL